MPAPELLVQTTYAELLDRCSAAAFLADFAERGAFISKKIRGRRYWYFQGPAPDGKRQKYIGPETPELLDQIRRHKALREDEGQRRAMVSALVRSFGSPRPSREIGDVLSALARAGVFRLRGVLIGTVAFQTYAPMLGTTLGSAALRTDDVDIAQFKSVSVATGDRTESMLKILQEVDKTFRPVPHQVDGRRFTQYRTANQLRVDFLTPNEGPDSGEPQRLPSLRTDAEPLRFLDFLIHEPEPAVALHGAGLYVLVPQPQRFAIHKLIVSQRRLASSPKRDKDLRQAESLLDVLAHKRPFELREAWFQAYDRGATWRKLLLEGLAVAAVRPRDMLLRTIDAQRSNLPAVDLVFSNSPPRYDFDRDVVSFEARETFGATVPCAISREALDDHFDASGLDQQGRLAKFLENRARIEALARAKYLWFPVEEPSTALVKTDEIPLLRNASPKLDGTPQGKAKRGAP